MDCNGFIYLQAFSDVTKSISMMMYIAHSVMLQRKVVKILSLISYRPLQAFSDVTKKA